MSGVGAWRQRLALLSIFMAPLGACGGDGGPAFVPPSADAGKNLMVIDEGIDLAAGDFSGKTIAAYTVTCGAATNDGGPTIAEGGGPLNVDGIAARSFADQKQAIIAALAIPDDSCHLVEGIGKKADPLASIARYRGRWNAAMRNNVALGNVFTSAELADIMPPLVAELTTYRYHGTSTAGTAAHENSDVRLVLVERTLGDASEVEQTYTCVAQVDLDRFSALYTDPDVLAAYAAKPSATLDDDYARVVGVSDVGLMNESFGSPARLFLDQLQQQAQCATADLSGYFAALGGLERLDAQKMAAAAGPHPLRVQSAGNDGAEIDSVGDDIDCAAGDPLTLTVGSIDLQGNPSTFTNHGGCVDVYAPGESVLAPYAGGWLFAVDGTSFSAPLIARTLSLAASVPYDATQAKTALLAKAQPSSLLLPSSFPRDFFYEPGTTSLALMAGPVSAAISLRPTRIDMRRALGPLARRHGPR